MTNTIRSLCFLGAFIAALTYAAPEANAHPPNACRALHEAVFMDEPSEVLALIREGVDVNCLDQLRHTPIITATSGASLESFIVLLRHGAKLNVKDEWGMTLIRRIQDHIQKYQAMNGGEMYRKIYQRMADVVDDGAPVN